MQRQLKSPLKWYGGKTRLARKLIPLIPEHETYVEAFGGSAAVLFDKDRSELEVINDTHSGLVNFYRVLRHPERSIRLKNMLRKAVEWDYLEDSPAKPTKWIKTSRGTVRFLSREEAERFLEVCKGSNNPHFQAIVIVALNTGMRRGEILRLRWEDVDFRRGRIQVVGREHGHTKNYESRTIPMNSVVKEALKKAEQSLCLLPHSAHGLKNFTGYFVWVGERVCTRCFGVIEQGHLTAEVFHGRWARRD